MKWHSLNWFNQKLFSVPLVLKWGWPRLLSNSLTKRPATANFSCTLSASIHTRHRESLSRHKYTTHSISLCSNTHKLPFRISISINNCHSPTPPQPQPQPQHNTTKSWVRHSNHQKPPPNHKPKLHERMIIEQNLENKSC